MSNVQEVQNRIIELDESFRGTGMSLIDEISLLSQALKLEGKEDHLEGACMLWLGDFEAFSDIHIEKLNIGKLIALYVLINTYPSEPIERLVHSIYKV